VNRVENQRPQVIARTMSHEQLYEYDASGFVLLRGLLPPDLAAACREGLRRIPPDEVISERSTERWEDIHGRGGPFQDVVRTTGLLDHVVDVVNQPLRLIESYAHRSSAGSFLYMHNGLAQDIVYHGGLRATRHVAYGSEYHDGRLYTRYVKAVAYLTDIGEEDGPFCYVEGSHKASFPYPWPYFGDGDLDLVSETDRVRTVRASAGDVLLLNEALLHGARRKRTAAPRMLLAYSFAPAFMAPWQPLDRADDDYESGGYHDLDCEVVFFPSGPPAPAP
jgi:Phytanoyl-CoA dioxygenase (PhyH)